jgi:hypothetical protein
MKDNEFPNALSNWRYRVEPDKSVTALNTENGEQCRFPDWAAFWKRVGSTAVPVNEVARRPQPRRTSTEMTARGRQKL